MILKNNLITSARLLIVSFILALTTKSFGYQVYPTYEENQIAFTKQSQSLQNKDNILVKQWSWQNNPDDKTLKTDLSLFNLKNKPHNTLIVFSSGLHGIEGYTGSMLQRELLKETLEVLKYADLLMVHSLNPWGMKYKRRVNENNIDLNRHFLSEKILMTLNNNTEALENRPYDLLNTFLNPKSIPTINFLSRLQFLAESLILILRNGIEPIRRSILLGQYKYSNGLYFGGGPITKKNNLNLTLNSQFSNDPLRLNILNLFKNDLKNYKKIIWVDLHTGYGAKGELHILSNETEKKQQQLLAQVFKPKTIDFGNQKNFYQTQGDFSSFLNLLSNEHQSVFSVVFEYGTMDSQKTLGSIESLRRMILENQLYHQKNESSIEVKQQIETLFSEMFFPEDPNWNQQVLDKTNSVLTNLYQNIN